MATTDLPLGYRVWSDRSGFGLGLFDTQDAANAALAQFVADGWAAYDLRVLVEPSLAAAANASAGSTDRFDDEVHPTGA